MQTKTHMQAEPNREMEYRQRTFELSDVEGMVKAMHEDGFALIPGVLSQSEVQEARDAIDRLQPAHDWDRLGGKSDHIKNVFNQDPYWLQFIDRPGVIDLAERTMGADCHIIGQSAWRSRPGHDGTGLHIDQMMLTLPEDVFDRPGFELPHYICTAHYYLSDVTLELCPTWVVPRSHRSGRGPAKGETSWNGNELQPVLCKAGDVLFFRCEIWHQGSLNATADQVRYLLQVHYGRRNTAQHFMPFLKWQFNPETIAAANKRQLRLLGDHAQSAYD